MNLPWAEEWRTAGWTGVVAVAAVVLAVAVQPVFGSLVFAIWVYYATRRVHRRVVDAIGHPNVAATTTVLLVLLPILLIVGFAAWTAIKEISDVLAHSDLEQYQSILRPYVDISEMGPGPIVEQLRQNPQEAFDQQLRNLLSGAFGRVTTAAGFVFSVLVRVFLMLVFVFYLLRDDHKLAGWFRGSVGADARVVAVFEDVDDHLETVFVGNVVSILVLSVFAVTVYNGMDYFAPAGYSIPYPFLLGLLTGVGTIVPGVGIKIVYYPLTLFLFAVGLTTDAPLWFPVFFVAVTQIVVDVIPDIFLRSYFSAGDLHMGLVLFAYIVGSIAFGWYGVFLGPILLIAIVVVGREVFPDVAMQFRSLR